MKIYIQVSFISFMEKSDEIQKIVLEFHKAMENADETFFSQMLSQKDGLVMIGSDPEEWLTGHANIVKILKSQFDQMSGCKVIPKGNLQAFCEGAVGWFAEEMTFKMPDGIEIPFRITGVFHQENNEWKAVQFHASIGMGNEEAGMDLE
ncbi:hypothetical protein LCGC14_0795320 [marine sediment metagenome]|uniref:SnoaL-like domain-containing protein n=1 Tax=marine sediment metagenome TaxID=412755 RepID=A0A0F9PRC6_9ZZZZ